MSSEPKVLSKDMLNLGYVIKASRLLEFEPVLLALEGKDAKKHDDGGGLVPGGLEAPEAV